MFNYVLVQEPRLASVGHIMVWAALCACELLLPDFHVPCYAVQPYYKQTSRIRVGPLFAGENSRDGSC